MGVFGGIPYYQRFFNLKKSFQVGEHKANFMKGIHIRCKYKIATENYIYIYISGYIQHRITKTAARISIHFVVGLVLKSLESSVILTGTGHLRKFSVVE